MNHVSPRYGIPVAWGAISVGRRALLGQPRGHRFQTTSLAKLRAVSRERAWARTEKAKYREISVCTGTAEKAPLESIGMGEQQDVSLLE